MDEWAVDECGWVRLTQDHCWDPWINEPRQADKDQVPKYLEDDEIMQMVWKLGRSRRALHVSGRQPAEESSHRKSPCVYCRHRLWNMWVGMQKSRGGCANVPQRDAIRKERYDVERLNSPPIPNIRAAIVHPENYLGTYNAQ